MATTHVPKAATCLRCGWSEGKARAARRIARVLPTFHESDLNILAVGLELAAPKSALAAADGGPDSRYYGPWNPERCGD